MGVVVFLIIAYCIFYAIPKSIYRAELKRSNNPLVAIFAVIIPIVLGVIFIICYNMENQRLGAYIFMGLGVVMFILTIYAHWYKWKEKREKPSTQSAIEEYQIRHAKYLQEMEHHERTLDMIRNETENRYRR